MVDIDEQIFSLLQDDGRASYSAMAQRIGVSRTAITARVDALMADGSLRVVSATHPDFLGLHSISHVSIQTDGPSDPVVEALSSWPAVVLVLGVGGIHNLVVEIRLPNQVDLYATIGRIRSLPGVLTVNTLVYVDVVKGIFMPRHALPENVKVDDVDLQLMRRLEQDGRMSYRDLAPLLGLSPSAVRNRVNYLLENHVIRIGAAHNRRGRTRNVATGLGVNLRGDGASVLDVMATLPGIEFLARTIGRFDLVATLAADSAATLRNLIDRLRQVDDVVKIESWMHLEVFKEKYEWPVPDAAGPFPFPSNGAGRRP
jgi:DNA-binding Lrp family transcriptional regulator